MQICNRTITIYLSVYSDNLKIIQSKFREFFCGCCLWPLCYPAQTELWHIIYLQFCGWRDVLI